MKSISNLPEWGNVCKTVSKSRAARVTMLNNPKDTQPKPQLWKKGARALFTAWTPFWMISWFHSLPFPLPHSELCPHLISSGPQGSADYLSLSWLTRWGHQNTENVLCRVILIEPLVLGTKLKVPAGKKESHSTWKKKKVDKDKQKAKYVAGSFHEFWTIFSSPFWSLFSLNILWYIC